MTMRPLFAAARRLVALQSVALNGGNGLTNSATASGSPVGRLMLLLRREASWWPSASCCATEWSGSGGGGGGGRGGGGTQEAAAGERFSGSQPGDPPPAPPAALTAMRRELQEAAARGQGPEPVLQVVERSGQHFDEEVLVAALAAVADAYGTGAGGSRGGEWEGVGELVRNDTFQSLLSMVMAGAERLTPSQTAAVARSLGRLRVADEGVLEAIGRNVVSELPHMTGGELADLLEAYTATGLSPGRVIADAAHQRLRGPPPPPSGQDGEGGRATADGVPLSQQVEAGGGRGGGGGPPLGAPEAERVRHALEELGYSNESATGVPPRQGQSDRSHGADYA